MKRLLIFLLLGFSLVLVKCKNSQPQSQIEVTSGIDPESGLAIDPNLMLVKGQCTACHSAKLITQNRFTREGWKDKIIWMQKTQNLWDLGESEPAILDYLAKHYAPEARASRRANLENVEWYKLNED